MKITKLSTKYKIGCNKGIAKYNKKSLLLKLNSIIEWDTSTIISKNDKKELVPGDCFLIDEGQIIAVNDEDTLILIQSETGPRALERICEHRIFPEFNLIFNNESSEIFWKSVDKIEDNYESYPIDYDLFKIFIDKFISGRGFNKNFIIQIKYKSDFLIFEEPIILYITSFKIHYNKDFIMKELIEDITYDILSWFYNNENRIINKN